MGYLLNGQKPTAANGQELPFSVWDWPNVASLCQHLAPEETSPCEVWAGEECYGHGLDAAQSVKLAEKLEQLLNTGRVSAYLDDTHEPDRREFCDEKHVRAFVLFLQNCGGFYIG